MDESTKDRIVKNEVLFRDVNERVKGLDAQHGVPSDELWDFLCECGDANCIERVSLTVEEYERVRSNSVHFAVVPGHEEPAVERVVERTRRYAVVEKRLGEQQLALKSDPRGS